MRLALGVILFLGWATARALTITHVGHEAEMFRPDRGESLVVRFRLSEPALVVMSVYDAGEMLRRKVYSDGVLPVGDHKLSWDGRDSAGRVVPPEAYHYTLTAYSPTGASVEYDLTDLTGGKTVWIHNAVWDPGSQRLRYVLPGPARVNIRAGLSRNRVLMKTILNWAVRTAGPHAEEWDGKDAAGVLDIGTHPDSFITVRALLLSRNTVIVGPEGADRPLLETSREGGERRNSKRSDRRSMYDPGQIPLERLGDFVPTLRVVDGARTATGTVVARKGKVNLAIDVPLDVRRRIADERFEIVMFVDGAFVDELESAFLPLTWEWDASTLASGLHFVTVNIRGYEGNFGATTLAIELGEDTRVQETAQ